MRSLLAQIAFHVRSYGAKIRSQEPLRVRRLDEARRPGGRVCGRGQAGPERQIRRCGDRARRARAAVLGRRGRLRAQAQRSRCAAARSLMVLDVYLFMWIRRRHLSVPAALAANAAVSASLLDSSRLSPVHRWRFCLWLQPSTSRCSNAMLPCCGLSSAAASCHHLPSPCKRL